MTDQLVQLAEQHRYDDLFRKRLRWGGPDVPPIHLTLSDNQTVTVTNVSTYKGIRVWVCDTMPGAKAEAEIDRLLSTGSTDRLVIFHGHGAGAHADQQVWRWPVRHVRGHLTSTRLARHRHRTGAPDTGFAHRLNAIQLPADTVLDATEVLTRLRRAFDVEQHNETKQASQLMATMYAAMATAYPATFDAKRKDHEISMTLARILFLLFGDDTDMWQPDGFRDHLLLNTKSDGTDLRSRLQELFDGLNDPAGAVSAALPYVNGGIFREPITLPAVGTAFRRAVLEACVVDWSTISPAIFGSMFQSVRDSATRRSLGEHYTSETNILKTLGPLFLDALHNELAEATTPQALRKLWTKVGDVRFIDPACGCGNFIIVAYRELRDIELQIMERLKDNKSNADQLELEPTLALRVTLDHFYGIEIDEWPARIAETAMFLINRQCDLKLKERFGEAPQRLPIQQQAAISITDALTVEWTSLLSPSENVIIAGNPPFLGHISRTPEQTEQLRAAWGGKDIGRLDFVTAWYAKAIDFFKDVRGGQWAFVSTSSVSQGDQVPRLFGPVFSADWKIKFAHRTFAWTSEASGTAAVHCTIIGFCRTYNVAAPRLFEYATPKSNPHKNSTKTINAYLVDGPNVLVDSRQTPLSRELTEVTFGNMPRDGGHLIVTPEDYDGVMADPIAAKYVRLFLGSEELVHNKKRWCLWMSPVDPSDIENSPVLKTRVAGVKTMRLKSKAPSTKAMAATPYLFGQRPALLTTSYLGIPRVVSENRPYFTAARLNSDVIPSDRLFSAPDPDGLLFAVISSSMFITWQKTVGNRLESRPSFSNTLVWNNLPLPSLTTATRKGIISAGEAVQAARGLYPSRSLADHYNPLAMDSTLVAAHDELDALVDRAFGASKTCTNERERQAILFARYQELTRPL